MTSDTMASDTMASDRDTIASDTMANDRDTMASGMASAPIGKPGRFGSQGLVKHIGQPDNWPSRSGMAL